MEPLINNIKPLPVYQVPTVTHQPDVGEVYVRSRLCTFDSISIGVV